MGLTFLTYSLQTTFLATSLSTTSFCRRARFFVKENFYQSCFLSNLLYTIPISQKKIPINPTTGKPVLGHCPDDVIIPLCQMGEKFKFIELSVVIYHFKEFFKLNNFL